MRLLSLFPFSRPHRLRTIKIKRVLPAQRTAAIVFHSVPAATAAGIFTVSLVVLGMAEGATVWGQPKAIVDPALLAVLMSAHACAVLFALSRNAH